MKIRVAPEPPAQRYCLPRMNYISSDNYDLQHLDINPRQSKKMTLPRGSAALYLPIKLMNKENMNLKIGVAPEPPAQRYCLPRIHYFSSDN